MKIDLYTKFVLTIIAISLVWIGTQQSIGNAIAQSSIVSIANEPLKVVICNEKNTRCVDVAHGDKLEVDVD